MKYLAIAVILTLGSPVFSQKVTRQEIDSLKSNDLKQRNNVDRLHQLILEQNETIKEQNRKIAVFELRSEVLTENQSHILDLSDRVINFLSILITIVGIAVPIASYYFGIFIPKSRFEKLEKEQTTLIKELRSTQTQVLRTHYDSTKGIYRVSTGIRYSYHIFQYDDDQMSEIIIATVLNNVISVLNQMTTPEALRDLKIYAPLPEARTYLAEMAKSSKPHISGKAAEVEEKIKSLLA